MKAWLAALACCLGALELPAQSGTGPLTLSDLRALLATGIDADTIMATALDRGLSFEGTPAVRKALIDDGTADQFVQTLLPARVADGLVPLKSLGIAVAPPSDWEPLDRKRQIAYAPKSLPEGLQASVALRHVDIADELARDEDPKRRTLNDYLSARAKLYAKRHGYRTHPLEVIAAAGLTGVAITLERDAEGDRLAELMVDAIFPVDPKRLLSARLTVRGETASLRARRTREDFLAFLSRLGPVWGSENFIAEVPEHSRVAVLLAPSDEVERRLIVIDRDGRESAELAKGAIRGLIADPLAQRLCYWHEHERITLGPRGRLRDAFTAPAPRFGIWHPKDGWVPLSMRSVGESAQPLLGSGEAAIPFALGCDPVADATGRVLWTAKPGAASGSMDLQRVEWSGRKRVASPPVSLRPATRVEVVSDPGSDALLCLVAGTHFPLPQPGQTERPVTAHRLIFVGPQVDERRPLLFRKTTGVDRPTWRQPRFMPSAHEILVIDDRDRLLVLSRQGGMPVVLHEGPVFAAAPFIHYP